MKIFRIPSISFPYIESIDFPYINFFPQSIFLENVISSDKRSSSRDMFWKRAIISRRRAELQDESPVFPLAFRNIIKKEKKKKKEVECIPRQTVSRQIAD